MSRKLTVDHIDDLRAYERTRTVVREQMIELRRRRRVHLGPFISVSFENRDTVKYQIQEMARIERLITDEALEAELQAYNPLIPEVGQLCATLFIELTSDDAMREWLPKLIGIEHSLVLTADGATVVRAVPEEGHASQLTRSDVTSAVHYYRFECTPDQVATLALAESVQLACDHPSYLEASELAPFTRDELLLDLRG